MRQPTVSDEMQGTTNRPCPARGFFNRIGAFAKGCQSPGVFRRSRRAVEKATGSAIV